MKLQDQVASILVFLLLSVTTVHAEVLDKELSTATVIAWSLIGSVLGWLLCRRVPLAFVVSLPAALLGPCSAIESLSDPHVGPALLTEAGQTYLVAAYLGATSVAIAHALALATAVGRWRTRSRRSPPDPQDLTDQKHRATSRDERA